LTKSDTVPVGKLKRPPLARGWGFSYNKEVAERMMHAHPVYVRKAVAIKWVIYRAFFLLYPSRK
jgi:hypothetical protein